MRAIKRSFALALCLCLLLGSCGTLAESFSARQIDFCKEYVNLRERPDSKSRSLGQVYIGEVVVAAPYDDAFSYCCYNGQYGYIRSEYLNANIQPWSEGTFYVTNCDEYISLRKLPLKSSDRLAKIPLGATLDEIYYHDGGYTPDSFVYVKYRGQYGFVLWDYLSADRSRPSKAMAARQVARCDEYVNLRQAPSSKARSLDRV